MPLLPLTPEEFDRKRKTYDPVEERRLRDLQAVRGEHPTCPASNAFFKARVSGRRFHAALDLGSHDGSFAAEVLSGVADHLVLVDFSGAALEKARTRLPGAETVQADLAREWTKVAPLARFPLVSLCEVIQHMPQAGDREAVFAGAADMLTPGGILLFSTYFERPGEPADGFFHSDRHSHLLFFHRSSEEENLRRFRAAGLQILDRMREERVDAFVLMRVSEGTAT